MLSKSIVRHSCHFLRLCLVIGRSDCHPHSMQAVIHSSILAGVSSIQLRDKYADEDELADLAKDILKILPKHIPLIINDHLSVAKYLRCALHIGQEDVSYHEARKAMGANAIIGLSIENYQQALACRGYDADYFGVGPIFPTRSKPDAHEPIGIDELAKIVKVLNPRPCIAIGGIKGSNIASLVETGVVGAAVISAITRTDSSYYATKELLTLWNNKGKKDDEEKDPQCTQYRRF